MNLLDEIIATFEASIPTGGFNGLAINQRLHNQNANSFRAEVERLVRERHCDLCSDINPHIKRFPSSDVENQTAYLKPDWPHSLCLYPSRRIMESRVDQKLLIEKPYSGRLALADAQLEFVGFELQVLDRYLSNPKFKIKFFDYMGQMSAPGIDETSTRDLVYLQTFGLGMNQKCEPNIVVFLRYLSSLTAEHQRYWQSFECQNPPTKMLPQYFQASIEGKFWENRNVRYAICEEIKTINVLCNAIFGQSLFQTSDFPSYAIDITAFLTPTRKNFDRFVQALDKLLSENLRNDFFSNEGLEADDSNGHLKGSITLFHEWLLKAGRWSDQKGMKEVIVDPFRSVRKLRQKPSHKIVEDEYSSDFFKQRRDLLWNVFNSLSNLRQFLQQHELATEVVIPKWLDGEKIDVF